MDNKLLGWKEKLLSNVRKEFLIKSVAQAISTYSMSCFKIPGSICDDLASMIRSFGGGKQWGEQDCLVELEGNVSANGGKGGGGGVVWDLKAFNIALLAKQGW